MNKKLFIIITFVLTFLCYTNLYIPNTVVAQGNVQRIEITKSPVWTTYTQGQNLYLVDMELMAYYLDGSNELVQDYTITGYDNEKIGLQEIQLSYEGYSTVITIKVLPRQVTNITATNITMKSITLQWDEVKGAKGYEVYSRDEVNGGFSFTGFADMNTITLEYDTAAVRSYYICAVAEVDGVTYTGELSEKYKAATSPDTVTGVTVKAVTTSSVELVWKKTSGATGYIIYRAPLSSNKYTQIASTKSISYTDKSVPSGTTYKYQIKAYILNKDNVGAASSSVEASTKLSSMVLKVKAGDEKARITWKKVNGATFYDLYMAGDNGVYKKINTRSASSELSYLVTGLTNDKTYTFYGVARRTYNGTKETTPESTKVMITPIKLPSTSTAPRIFPNKAAFLKSAAYTGIEFFGKNVVYSKSFVIPGLTVTNTGGFVSYNMCPQGLTFAGDYLLMTAYDMSGEEQSVINVMDKSTKKLLTTIVLPTVAHVGGMAYDGQHIWISMGSNAGAVSYEAIDYAAKSKKAYTELVFEAANKLGIVASYMTFYNDLLWVGTYNELEATVMNSYRIEPNGDEPVLVKVGTMTMPTRVQGISFTKNGYLILSRSCQLYQGLRGYMRQLDVYKPDLSDSEEKYSLGDVLNTVEMPSMNEEISIDGNYLYVNFESGAFTNASYRVDRISAFKLSSILPKK